MQADWLLPQQEVSKSCHAKRKMLHLLYCVAIVYMTGTGEAHIIVNLYNIVW